MHLIVKYGGFDFALRAYWYDSQWLQGEREEVDDGGDDDKPFALRGWYDNNSNKKQKFRRHRNPVDNHSTITHYSPHLPHL